MIDFISVTILQSVCLFELLSASVAKLICFAVEAKVAQLLGQERVCLSELLGESVIDRIRLLQDARDEVDLLPEGKTLFQA